MASLQFGVLSWRYGVRRGLGKLALAATLAFLPPTLTHAEEMAIAALGDSLTQGYGLIEQEGFVPQLSAWLKARGEDVLVINAGVSGDTTAGGLARVNWTMDSRVRAMIVALGGNDLLRGIDPATSRANIEGILQAAAAKDVNVLLVGISAPGNYGPEYKAAFDAIFPELAKQYDAILYPSFLQALQTGDMRATLAEDMQPDGIHPNGAGVAKIVADIGPYVLKLIAAAR